VSFSCGSVFFHGDYSPTTSTAPSLRAHVLSDSSEVPVNPGIQISTFLFPFSFQRFGGGGGRNYICLAYTGCGINQLTAAHFVNGHILGN
jgi:hypothetical protein